MSRCIITITRQPGRGYLSTFKAGNKCQSNRDISGSGPEAAAAEAMNLAVLHGEKGYAIFAPAEVMSLIPMDMRSQII